MKIECNENDKMKWTTRNLLGDRMRNGCIYKKLEVTSIKDYLVKTIWDGLGPSGMCNVALVSPLLKRGDGAQVYE